MTPTRILTSNDPAAALDTLCRSTKQVQSGWFVVTDSNVAHAQASLFSRSEILAYSPRFTLTPGEDHKNPSTLLQLWQWLSEKGATRSSGIVNVGGGMVTDLGGFAAATFKRGIPYVNLPTTLLGAVDASVGGKTAVNLNGLKNEVGAFAPPAGVVASAAPLATLPHTELLSGYAEMLKTGLISSPGLYQSLMDVDGVLGNPALLADAMRRCIEFKQHITDTDPHENGLRKILNFGHTAGHAFESLSHHRGRPVPHGIAVAWGIAVALVLSHMLLGMDTAVLYGYMQRVLTPFFPPAQFSCDDYGPLLDLMAGDKKNLLHGHPRFVLLQKAGSPVTDIEATPGDITAALDITRDLSGR